MQITDLKLAKTKIRVLNYHGIWSKDKRGAKKTLEACKKIKELALEANYPSIICGDFNLFPDTESMQVFYNNFVNLVDEYDIKTTRPGDNELSSKKRNVVDYILVDKRIKVNNFRVVNSNVSDHLPLVLEFET